MPTNKQKLILNFKTIITIILLALGLKWPLIGLVGIIVMWVWMKWKTWVKVLVSSPIIILGLISIFAILIAINPAKQVKKAQLAQVSGNFVTHLNQLVEAENAESWEDFIYEFHMDSPARTDASESTIKELWKNQKTNVSIKSWKVISATEDIVIFEVLFTDKSNPEKTGTISSNIEFRQEGEDWKIYTTSINEVTYDN